jgi:glyoxylase-like metal-dependent hydrolase (beta-lactamase superfamily II)
MSAWTDLGGGMQVRQSRCYAMNSLFAVRDGHVLLADPGVLPSELDELAAATQAVTSRFERVSIAFTHPHWDHVLGLPWFPGAETFAHSGFGDALESEAARVQSAAEKGVAELGETLRQPFQAFSPLRAAHGTALARLGEFDVVTYDTPGHQSTHLALWLPQSGVFVAGDLLSDIEIPWLDAPPWVYRASLKSLHWVFEQEDVRVLVPGHGPLAYGRLDGYRRLLRDMDYLMHLEERVNAAWKRGAGLEETRAELAAMDYLGKDASYPMNEVHAENVKFAWQALANGEMPGQ